MRFLHVRLQAFQFELCVAMPAGVQANIGVAHAAPGTEISEAAAAVISLKFITSRLTAVCRAAGKRAVLVLRVFTSKDGRKLEMFSLEHCTKIVEETRRIQGPILLIGKKPKPRRQ